MTFIKSVLVLLFGLSCSAYAEDGPNEIFCTIRDGGMNLNCQWIDSKDRRTMTPDDISTFIDRSLVNTYITVRSKKGMERTFQVDANAAPLRRLNEMKKLASISEVGRAKLEAFAEMEKKAIKLSDEMDSAAMRAELLKPDSSIVNEKFKRQMRPMSVELTTLRTKNERLCTVTPEFERVTKTNVKLSETLSSLLHAFQQPDTCLDGFKLSKTQDGSVDLRQLESLGKAFQEKCKKTSKQ